MVSVADARRLLGVSIDATADDVRAARRRMAKHSHPDLAGGDAEAMRRLNEAADAILEALGDATFNDTDTARRGAAGPHAEGGGRGWGPGRGGGAASDTDTARRGATGPHAEGGVRGWGPGRGGGAASETDIASFVIEALPAVAFEALLVVTSWIGEVVADEPPYQLDVLVLDPLRCWCRLDLVPDAGASTVSLTIAALPDEALPDIDDVRDLWVAALNDLGP